MACRQRDILPLPHFAENSLNRARILSRSVARRVVRANKPVQWANDAISALNELGGRGVSEPPPHSSLGAGSVAALSHIAASFDRIGDPPAQLSPEGALRELLGSTSIYQDGRSDVLPYARDRVSWPPPGARPSRLLDLLGGGRPNLAFRVAVQYA